LNKGNDNRQKLESCYFGKSYDDEIEKELEKFSNYVTYDVVNDSELYDMTAKYISEGNIIGWYQDGAETGPRALGNRSILADPRVAEMKDILNKRVKFREHFRPFAPMVIKEKVKDYFEGANDNAFMLFVEQVKKDKQSVIPAVTHVDGSARLQTVGAENNKKMYNLLLSFEKITGVPVILNTSFNIKGQPIVETPLTPS
jgi:carbamoyltransferase